MSGRGRRLIHGAGCVQKCTEPCGERRGGPAEADALRYLAEVDSRPRLKGDVLLAMDGDEPVAAIGVASGKVVADPFRHTAATVELLRLRRSQHTQPARSYRSVASVIRRMGGRRVAQAA
jgi:hypothetical protein